MKINDTSLQMMLLHCAKNPSDHIAGVLLGIDEVSYCIPLTHALFLPSAPFKGALLQIEIYAKSIGQTILGFYFSNQIKKSGIPLALEQIAKGSKVLIEIKHDWQSPTGIQLYTPKDNSWNASDYKIPDDLKAKVRRNIQNKEYEKLSDFDEHLTNVSLDWIKNLNLLSTI